MGADGRKSIFITGAASGIGRETALLFHEQMRQDLRQRLEPGD